MDLISTRSFPSLPLVRRSLAKPLPPPASQTLGAASRHLRWAAGITSKLVRQSRWPLLHPEAMTLSHPSRTRILHLQTLLRQTHSHPQMYSSVLCRHPIQFIGPDSLGNAAPKPAPAARAIMECHHALVSFVREIVRATAPAALTSTAIRWNRMLEFVDRRAPPILRSIPNNLGPTASLLLPARAIMEPGHPSAGPDSSTATLPERVLRRHRRIEAQPFLHSVGAVPQVAAALMPEEPAVIHRTAARRRAQQLDVPAETEQRARTAPPAPSVNVAQITDAVLQQLDRRLIAARERMGRI